MLWLYDLQLLFICSGKTGTNLIKLQYFIHLSRLRKAFYAYFSAKILSTTTDLGNKKFRGFTAKLISESR